MLRFPNAKINIGLNITGKRPDGFHNIETVFFPVPAYCDALEILPAADSTGSLTLHLSGNEIAGSSTHNLVQKAFDLLSRDFPDKVKSLSAFLYKKIPMGAGMGGGSADGAFMLQMINDYCSLDLSKPQLKNYALQLGSDCPFFIENRPCFASGRGEILEPVDLDLSAYRIEIKCPGIHVSTAMAYQSVTPSSPEFDLRAIGHLPVEQWKDRIWNDFEAPVFKQYPELKEIKQQFYGQGAVYASMSGSGSSIYGIFRL